MVEVLAAAERQCAKDFCRRVAFPSYSACAEILRGEIELWAEFGEMNHELLQEIYRNGFARDEFISEKGYLILRRGGQRALWANSYALNRIMCHLVSQCDPDLVADETIIDPATGNNMILRKSTVLCNANVVFVNHVWEDMVEGVTITFAAGRNFGDSDSESDSLPEQCETSDNKTDSQQPGPAIR